MFWNTKRDNFSECTESCGIKAKQVRNQDIMKQARNPGSLRIAILGKKRTTTRTRSSHILAGKREIFCHFGGKT